MGRYEWVVYLLGTFDLKVSAVLTCVGVKALRKWKLLTENEPWGLNEVVCQRKSFFSGNFKIMRKKVKFVLVKPDDEFKKLYTEEIEVFLGIKV